MKYTFVVTKMSKEVYKYKSWWGDCPYSTDDWFYTDVGMKRIEKACPKGYVCVWNMWDSGYKYRKLDKDGYYMMDKDGYITFK